MRKINLLLVLLITICPLFLNAQDVNTLVQKVKAKLDKVSDYEASGKMKTNVTFLKVPVANIKLYYKKPDKVKIKNEKGFSFIPKGAVNINMSNSINNINNINYYSNTTSSSTSVASYKVKVFLRTRADGPTKVCESDTIFYYVYCSVGFLQLILLLLLLLQH